MKKRPAWVWVITIFYLISLVYTIFSFYLVFNGAVPLTAAQQSYFASLGKLDLAESAMIGLINLAATVSLFMLRRIATILFSVALGLGILATVFQTVNNNWVGVIGGAGLFGAFISWVIALVIILYCRNLAKKGVLT